MIVNRTFQSVSLNLLKILFVIFIFFIVSLPIPHTVEAQACNGTTYVTDGYSECRWEYGIGDYCHTWTVQNPYSCRFESGNSNFCSSAVTRRYAASCNIPPTGGCTATWSETSLYYQSSGCWVSNPPPPPGTSPIPPPPPSSPQPGSSPSTSYKDCEVCINYQCYIQTVPTNQACPDEDCTDCDPPPSPWPARSSALIQFYHDLNDNGIRDANEPIIETINGSSIGINYITPNTSGSVNNTHQPLTVHPYDQQRILGFASYVEQLCNASDEPCGSNTCWGSRTGCYAESDVPRCACQDDAWFFQNWGFSRSNRFAHHDAEVAPAGSTQCTASVNFTANLPGNWYTSGIAVAEYGGWTSVGHTGNSSNILTIIDNSPTWCGWTWRVKPRIISWGIRQNIYKSCTVDINYQNVHHTTVQQEIMDGAGVGLRVTGYTNSGLAEPVRLVMSRKDFTRISPAPPNTYEFERPGIGGYVYFFNNQTSTCTTDPSTGSCQFAQSVSSLDADDYLIHCDMNQNVHGQTNLCSGNPRCTYEQPPFGASNQYGFPDTTTCGAWQSCHTQPAPYNTRTDNAVLSVVCTPGETTVNINSPTSPHTMTSSSFTTTWTAATPSLASYYDLKVYPQNTYANPEAALCTNSNVLCYNNLLTTSQVITPQPNTIGRLVTIAVRAVNTSCSVEEGSWAREDVNLVGNLTGTVRLDQMCDNNTIALSENITGSTFSVSTGGVVNPNVAHLTNPWNATLVPYNPSAAWTPAPRVTLNLPAGNSEETYICCGGGSNCSSGDMYTGSNWASPPSGSSHQFRVQRFNLANDGWWQARGGLAYSAQLLHTEIPQTCVDGINCNNFMITRQLESTFNCTPTSNILSNKECWSAGIPMSGTNSISTKVGGYLTDREVDFSNAPNAETKSPETIHAGIKETYSVLSQDVDLNSATQITTNPYTANPTQSSDSTTILYRNGDLTFTRNTILNISAGSKVIFFVNGNLTFNNPNNLNTLFTVEQGGYLAFIASGDIIFNQDVGFSQTPDNSATFPETASNVAGVFVADQSIIIRATTGTAVRDRKFVGQGTFVGWGINGATGIRLERDYTTNPIGIPPNRAYNNLYPTEAFVFRPDFLVNTPEELMRPNITWLEVN